MGLWMRHHVSLFCIFFLTSSKNAVFGFVGQLSQQQQHRQQLLCKHQSCNLLSLQAAKGFGASNNNIVKKKKEKPSKLSVSLKDDKKINKKSPSTNRPYVKSEQDVLLAQLQAQSAQTCIGRAVSKVSSTSADSDFWKLIPSLIHSKFPNVPDRDLERIAGFITHALDTNKVIDDSNDDEYRPLDEIHAYMPGLGPTKPFYDPSQLQACQLLTKNYDIIAKEYESLIEHAQDRFQSVTSMNYESGWQTLVLFYNGHRIPGFPYEKCPTTTRIMESLPLAGRIAGFNRQSPGTGIPLHTDGNNMWLTCQMGIKVPKDLDGTENQAWIRVGPDKKYWKTGECLLYDTTYKHETMNEHPTQERVVLHVDFFNTLAMTKTEIEVMGYIYSLREQFMKAEGVAKVGAHIL